MKTPKQIQDLIAAREAEITSVKSTHDSMWAKGSAELKSLADQHAAKQQQMNQEGAQNQLMVTRLEGCISELKNLLTEDSLEPNATDSNSEVIAP